VTRRSLAAAALLLAAAAPLRAQRLGGYVAAKEGHWTLYGAGIAQREVRLGMAVPPGALLAFTGESPRSARIVVRRLDGEVVVRECTAEGCGAPLRIGGEGREPGPAGRIVEAVAALFGHDPERYLPLMSRGGAGWSSAVLALDGGAADLAPVLAAAPPGPLSLRLEPLEADGAVADSFALDWRPGAPAVASLPGARPGLYRLVSLGAPPREAWVLLRPPPRAAEDAARFREAAALAPPRAGALDERETFLRAYLHHLSLQP
jgi:hypothetical protein